MVYALREADLHITRQGMALPMPNQPSPPPGQAHFLLDRLTSVRH